MYSKLTACSGSFDWLEGVVLTGVLGVESVVGEVEPLVDDEKLLK
jgi:hypothetical protein